MNIDFMNIGIDKLTLIYTICLCIIGIIFEIGYILSVKEKRKKQIFQDEQSVAYKSATKLDMFKRRFNESKFIKAYEKYLEEQIDLTFTTDDTVSMILHRQEVLLIVGLGIFIGSLFIFPPFISVLIFVGFTLAIVYPNLNFYQILKEKREVFDRDLPVFISKVLLTLNVGLNLENSLTFGVQSISHPLVKREFEKLIVEMRLHPDDISKAFVNLRKRIVGSQECEKFCNIVVSGLKNGNSMSSILTQELDRLSENQLKDIKEKQEKQSNTATAITVIGIFIPALLLLLLPLMSSSGM